MSLAKTSALMVAVFVILLAPAASAQGVPGGGIGDLPGGVTDTVGGTTGGVTDTVGDTTGGVTETVGGTTGGATDTVGGTTGGVTDTVGDTTGGVTDTVEETTGGPTDTVEETTGGVTNTVEDVSGGNGSGNGGNNDPVNETIKGLTGSGEGSTSNSSGSSSLVDALLGGGGSPPSLSDIPSNLIEGIVAAGAQNGMTPAAAEGWINGTKVTNDYSSPLDAVLSLTAMFEDALQDFAATSSVPGSSGWNAAGEPEGESFFAVAGRAAETAARALAFPLALAVLVVGFLMAQGRIGRKDPKLVLAPLDARSDTLTFE